MSAVSARVATVPGRNVIGIELPNARRETVFLRELLSTAALRGQPARPAAGAGQGHRRRPGDRRPRAHAASADRRHHRLGQVGGGQHHDPVAALPAAAGSVPLHHDRSRRCWSCRSTTDIPHLLDARRHRAAQGGRGAEMGGARDGGPLSRHDRSSACATSRATTSGWAKRATQGRGADPPGADRLRSRDAPADLRGRGARPRRRCPSSSSSSTRWPT